MRFNTAYKGPKEGDTRIKTGFLLFPKTINNDLRVFERATWLETYTFFWGIPEDGHTYAWVATNWLDNPNVSIKGGLGHDMTFDEAQDLDIELSKTLAYEDLPELAPCRCGGAASVDVSMRLISCEKCGMSFEYRYNRNVIPYFTWQLAAHNIC